MYGISVRHSDVSCFHSADGPDQLVLPPTAESVPPEAEPTPKPSKRLIILAEGKWGSDTDRSHVLKQLCERMARDQLDQPFWVWGYRIAPIGQTVEGSGPDRCIQYRVHISKPEPGPETQTEPGKSSSQETSTGTLQQVTSGFNMTSLLNQYLEAL